MIGGVAGGIAESLRIDPTIVRVVWVLLAFATQGLLVLVYFVLLFLIPEAPDEEPEARAAGSGTGSAGGGTAAASNARATSSAASPAQASKPSAGGRTGALVAGAILVLVGGFFLVRQYLPSIDLGANWPFIAVGLGIILIVASLRPGGRSS
jgi:phage shock protein PspC (stress-responsive transcriptional regulator)